MVEIDDKACSHPCKWSPFFARGGILGGNGGKIETSGRKIKGIVGISGERNRIGDLTEHWLIDPYNYTIGSSQASSIV